jgi:hypothetical protein
MPQETITIQHLRGRDGIEVAQPSGSVVTFRGDKVLRLETFWSHATALKAVGLEE